MAIEVQLSDLVGLYAKAGARILGRASDRFINSFHQIFKIDDDLRHDYFRDKGISLARRHRYMQAQKLLVELHEEYPEDVEVALYLGICYFKTGKLEESLPLLEEALKDRDDNRRLRAVLAKVYEGLGEQEKLLKILREDSASQAENFDAQMKLAVALDRVGEMGEAIEVLERALALDEDSLKAHRMVAVLYETQGNSEKATHHHKRVIELESDLEEIAEEPVSKSDESDIDEVTAEAKDSADPEVTVVDEEVVEAASENKEQAA